MTSIRRRIKELLRVNAVCLVVNVLLTSCLSVHAEESVTKTQSGEPFMEEIISTPEHKAKSWDILYAAYSCVYHRRYALAERWIMYAQVQASSELFTAREDPAYLIEALNSVARSRKQAPVIESSCELLVLRALIQNGVGGDRVLALEMMKRAALNNPTYAGIQDLKIKIKTMELALSDSAWIVPPDVAQTGGKKNQLSKWHMDKFPLKVFIAPDAAMAKVDGYKAGDGQFLRAGFEKWQSESGGKIRFVFVPAEAKADITCTWVSDQKSLEIADAIGVCSRWADQNNYLTKARIKVLTFSSSGPLSPSLGLVYRKNLLEEVCIHEIGHSLGLNHSSNEKDVMWPYAHLHPITVLTSHDVSAMTSLYVSNVHELISVALDKVQSGSYTAAIVPLNKAILMNAKDSQSRDTICFCLVTIARASMEKNDYKTAIDLLSKAKTIVSTSESKQTIQLVLKNLEYAYLQSGNLKEADQLEKQNTSLKATKENAASDLDQYGLKKESIPFYEKALAAAPNDLFIREKYCFLLVTLANDEISAKNDAAAIELLIRAKNLLRVGMPKRIIDRVMNTLGREYSSLERHEEAYQLTKEAATLCPPPVAISKVFTPQEDIACLVSAAKIKHPETWTSQSAQRVQIVKVQQAYEQYFDALRKFAASKNTENVPGWAAAIIVRHKPTVGPSAIGTVFELRNKLIALTDERAVIEIECRVALKKAASD